MHHIKQSVHIFIALAALGILGASEAAYYNTLPPGVRALIYRHVNTSKINSSFTGNNQEKDYFFKFNLDAQSIQSSTNILDQYFNPLKEKYPQAYEALELGEYEINADAKVSVEGFGIAYGVSNNITSYMSFPYYKAKVNLQMTRTKGNNNKEVQSLVASQNQGEVDTLINGITNSLPDVSGGVIQSVMVNYLDYEPLGDWEGSGMGDMEIGTIFKILEKDDYGFAATAGVVLPTGKTDNPDIIQDIGFGDGQFDVFGEYGGGVSFLKGKLGLDSFIRYTYQIPTEKTMRIPESEDYPLGSTKGRFHEKLGDKIDYSFATTYQINDWINVKGEYLFNYTMKSSYDSPHAEANKILAKNTDKESHTMKGELSLSTISLFKKGSFPMPMTFSSSAQKIITGKNIPNYTRVDFEVRFFF